MEHLIGSLKLYLQAVDHEKNCITVYDFQNDSGDDYTFSDTIPVGIYPDLEIDLSIINK